jgi:peptidoglycan/xylan/chitin deacetylase (PgdA/CDA1 family)
MIKNLAKRALLDTGVLRLAAKLHGKGAAILMYHSVLEDPDREVDSLGGIIHSREAFQGQMEMLAKKFRPVPLDEVGRFVKGERELPERAVVVTFDDGYTDNYEMAMPILDRVGIPATFYVTVDCVENRRLPWPGRLRFSFRKTAKKSWSDESGTVWSLESDQGREQAYLTICDRVCQLAGAALENAVHSIEEELDARLPDDRGRLMMTWEQVRGLALNGHIVGSHTMTHPNLAFLSIEEARCELVQSKTQMEQHLATRVEHFSYPCPALFPNWTEQTTAESRKAGYQTAVTTSNGLARKRDNPLCLKRVRPTKSVDGLRWNLENAFAGRAR